MLHFDGHTLSIKKVTFTLKSGEHFEKDNICGVNFDFGIYISMGYIHVKEFMTPQASFILQILIFKLGINGPIYCEMHQKLPFL